MVNVDVQYLSLPVHHLHRFPRLDLTKAAIARKVPYGEREQVKTHTAHSDQQQERLLSTASHRYGGRPTCQDTNNS